MQSSSQALGISPPFDAYSGEGPYTFVSYAHADKVMVFNAMRKLNFGENSPVQNCDVFSTLTKNFIGFADINFSKCACSGPNTHERY